jgi:hypothetical protein
MTLPRQYSTFAVLSILALLLSACGAAANQQPTIGTAVAQTVQAQNTLAAQATPTEPAAATNTPLTLATVPPLSTKAPPTAPPTGSSLCTASASFVSETIPDGTITSAGSTFTKTWRVKNTGTCSWDSTWKWVYVSGDLLGGSSFYNFPHPAAPGDTVDVPVVFTAPADGGSYRGYWKIKSPWGMVFGDSGSGNAFWVDIVVGSGTPSNSKTETAYGITNVTYDVSRTCTQANTFYTITAYISSNGPVTATYTWAQSDGNNKGNNKITFTSAATKSVTRDWSQHIGSSENPRWAQIIVTDPTYHEYPQFTLPPLCW